MKKNKKSAIEDGKLEESLEKVSGMIADLQDDEVPSNLETSKVQKQKKKHKIKARFKSIIEQYRIAFDLILNELIISNEKLDFAEKEKLLKEITAGQHHLKKMIESDQLVNEVEEGAKTFQQILGYSDLTLSLIYQLAMDHFNDKFDKASALFALLTLLDPNEHQYWLRYGMCLQVEGYWEEALNIFQLANATEPNDPLPYFFSSECYLEINDRAKALDSVNQALKLVEEQREKKYVDFKHEALKWKQTLV